LDKSFKVNEPNRMIVFVNGQRETFRNVTDVDAKGGDWLRFHADGNYIMVNQENILYIETDGKKVR